MGDGQTIHIQQVERMLKLKEAEYVNAVKAGRDFDTLKRLRKEIRELQTQLEFLRHPNK